MLSLFVNRQEFCKATGISKHALSNTLRRAKEALGDNADHFPVQLQYGNTRYIRPVEEMGETFYKMRDFREENKLEGLSHVYDLKDACTVIEDDDDFGPGTLVKPLFEKAKEVLVKDDLYETQFLVTVTDDEALEYDCKVIVQAGGYSLVNY